jgi:hypothetical protein
MEAFRGLALFKLFRPSLGAYRVVGVPAWSLKLQGFPPPLPNARSLPSSYPCPLGVASRELLSGIWAKQGTLAASWAGDIESKHAVLRAFESHQQRNPQVLLLAPAFPRLRSSQIVRHSDAELVPHSSAAAYQSWGLSKRGTPPLALLRTLDETVPAMHPALTLSEQPVSGRIRLGHRYDRAVENPFPWHLRAANKRRAKYE